MQMQEAIYLLEEEILRVPPNTLRFSFLSQFAKNFPNGINAITPNGWTILNRLIIRHREAAYYWLSIYGVDPNCLNVTGESAVVLAVQVDSSFLLGALLNKGANPDSGRTHHIMSSRYPALAIAVTDNKPDCVELLLEHGSDPAIHPDLLLHAVRMERYRIADLLLRHGAPVGDVNIEGSPLNIVKNSPIQALQDIFAKYIRPELEVRDNYFNPSSFFNSQVPQAPRVDHRLFTFNTKAPKPSPPRHAKRNSHPTPPIFR